MNALKEVIKTTFKWFSILLAGLSVSTVMVFFTQGDVAAAETLVGLGVILVLATIIIFSWEMSSRLR